MSFPLDQSGRIGRTKYWILFGLSLIAIGVLIVVAAMALFGGALFLAVLLALAIVGVGVYFRVAMMRRCRDIGWPAALPWIFFAAGFLTNFDSITTAMDGAADLPGFGLATLVGLADLAFAVTIGFIPGRSGHGADYYDTVFAPEQRDHGLVAGHPAYRDESDHEDDREARWNAAIQQALGAQSGATGGATGGATRPPAAPRPAGFGRKPVC